MLCIHFYFAFPTYFSHLQISVGITYGSGKTILISAKFPQRVCVIFRAILLAHTNSFRCGACAKYVNLLAQEKSLN